MTDTDLSPDHIGIGVYPASGVVSDSIEKQDAFRKGADFLRQLGFRVCVHELVEHSWYHLAGRPKDRADAVMELADNPEVDVLLPSIGGHTAAASLPFLDLDRINRAGKLVVGFSDNSLINLTVSANNGPPTLHCLSDVTFGFSAFAEGRYPATLESFLNAVRRGEYDLDISGTSVVQGGNGTGVTLGGNLHSLTQLAGTPYWPDWSGAILFWECADELHVMIQDLIHLANCGTFDSLAGMVIGKTTQLEEHFYERERVLPLDVLLLDVLELRGRFPIVREAPIGHDVENIAIPVGTTTTLSVGAASRWTLGRTET